MAHLLLLLSNAFVCLLQFADTSHTNDVPISRRRTASRRTPKLVKWTARCCITGSKATVRESERMRGAMPMVDSNTVGCYSRCDRCKKSIKTYNGIAGLHCRWCQLTLHKKCASQVNPECTLGPNRDHVIPPSCISPAVLVRESRSILSCPSTCLVRMNSGTADRAAQWQRCATRRRRCRRIDSVVSNYSSARYASVARLHQS